MNYVYLLRIKLEIYYQSSAREIINSPRLMQTAITVRNGLNRPKSIPFANNIPASHINITPQKIFV